MFVLSHEVGKPLVSVFAKVSVMSAADAKDTLATRAREASKSFFIEKVFKLLIRKLLCVLDLKMECDWDIAYPLWRKGTYIFPHCGGEYCVKSRGDTLKNINGRFRGLQPPATKGSPLRGYASGLMVVVVPGVAPPATKGSPLRGYASGSMVRGVPGVAPPGYKEVAPTGLCVGFNGRCGPGGCTPGYKRVAPTGLCVGINCRCGPGGCTPGYERVAPTGLYVRFNGRCGPGGIPHLCKVKG